MKTKYSNTKSILNLLVVVTSSVALILVMCLPAPVYAAASLTLNPASGSVGSTIQVIGKGFSGRLATIYWDDKVVANNIPISDTGDFNHNLTIPNAYKGTHTLRVTDNSNWTASSGTTEFVVLPQVTVFPIVAKETADITITGYGFSSSEKDIKITWDDKVISSVPITADRLGTWSIILPIPKTTKGEHYIGAFSSATGAAEIGKTKFIVAPYAKVTPLSGPVGTQLMIYGWGFRPNEDGVSMTWDGELFVYNIRAELDGGLIVDGSKVPFVSSSYTGDTREAVFIPPSTQGRHVLGIYGSSFTPKGVFNDSVIEVIPDIKLQTEPHIKGTQVTINGNGFASNETVNIIIDKTNNTTATSDTSGSFTAIIVVPVIKGKEYGITASANKGNSAQASFSISSTDKTTPALPTEIEFKLLSPAQGAKFTTFDSVGDALLGTIKYLFGVFDYLKGLPSKATSAPALKFTWVTTGDFTGVSYILQVARERNFSSTVLDKKISSHPEYTLSENEKLASSHYYWRVKAIDSNGHESQWSPPSEFEISSMSTKVAILTSVIVVLIVAAIVFGILTAIANLRRY